MAAILWNYYVISKKSDSVIYAKNISAKFHPDPIWNDGALHFLQRSPQQEQQEEEQDE